MNRADNKLEVLSFKVRKLIVHPNYDPKNQANDIALLEIYKPLVFAEEIQEIQIPWKTGLKVEECLIGGLKRKLGMEY